MFVTSAAVICTFSPSVVTGVSRILPSPKQSISLKTRWRESEKSTNLLSPDTWSIKSIKLWVALRSRERPFWQARYYDFNVFTEEKRVEKLRYMHRNPVKRGLVEKPNDWPWSSFRHYQTGIEGTVEIESGWTGWRREHGGALPGPKIRTWGTQSEL